ncbi:2-hydroxy-palmitic acid dioxygenase mpo1-like [Impatiens glandulifera]|uniref:2-hydroxy-palmitic acid dioxygenase mpo1-like n=1 Tax=Impatiens glandulifera TaxID=253017 RepID=UPI001FB17683|nr:2-hydroxy-palmitic acid dioxygenase mpo1-like [Impatiens glandulifera]
MGKIGLFDLEKHFSFYGAYHSNPINILIHIIFVWPIFFTAQVILYFTPALIECHFPCRMGLIPNIGFVVALIYSMFYICLDKKVGTLAAFLCFVCWVFGGLIAKNLGFSMAWKVVLVVQMLCWTGQFIGHGVFEKRAPTLLDNVLQPMLMAPFFVVLEVLWLGFGYEPFLGFHAKVKNNIDAEIKSFKEKKTM